VVGLGDDFESANAAVMYYARDIVNASKSASGELQKEIAALKSDDDQAKVWVENWYDGLTYCEFQNLVIFMSPSRADSNRHLERTWPTSYGRSSPRGCGCSQKEQH
jgi:hypothetical protein